ncbi:MAG: hypothetical protein VYA84_13385 [Planctomycetota bacterium]|nr:hypothetical protein [Planctomycetota bacterium]
MSIYPALNLLGSEQWRFPHPKKKVENTFLNTKQNEYRNRHWVGDANGWNRIE